MSSSRGKGAVSGLRGSRSRNRGTKRPALLAQWSRALIPVDGAHGSEARREHLVGVVADAMRRPLPWRATWPHRTRRFAVGVAVACLMLLAVGTGLAQTGVRSIVARISGMVRSAPEGVRDASGAPAGSPPGPAIAQSPPPPLASCPVDASGALARAEVSPAPRVELLASRRPATCAPSPVAFARPEATPSEVSPPAPATEVSPPAPVETNLASQNQLYARAMMARRSGNAAEALRALEEFILVFPGAPLAQDARVEHFRALAEAGDGAGASRAARQYLTLYPSGFARDEARALLSRADPR
jgi:hypothetical protein